jgi:uncharacterized protein YjbI with pentapeptide repeats
LRLFPGLRFACPGLFSHRPFGAVLGETNLGETNLGETNLAGANLSEVNQAEANLAGVILSPANL